MNVAGGDLNWVGTLNDSQFQQALNRMERNVNRTTESINSQSRQIEDYANRAKQAVAGYFSVQAATGFVSSLVDIRSQFQQLDIAFSTMLKSKVASDTLMKELIVFAGTTPFGLKDAAGAAKQLLAYGSTAKSVVGELRMLGDVASGVSVPIGDLVYLYGTLKTQGRAYAIDIRQFAGRGIPIYAELAKVLGVAKDQVASLVEAGKVGFPQVEQAFKNMTASGGMFGGLMEQQSKAWAGQIERLKDAWDIMLNDIGKSQEGLFADAIGAASDLVANYKKVLDILGLLIYSYGAYRAALIAYAVAQNFATASVVTYGLSVRQLTVMETLSAASKRILIQLQATYNAVLAASPIGATIALLAALGAVIYAVTQYVDAAEASQERFNSIQEEGGVSAAKETRSIKALVDVIKSHTATNAQREAAYKSLQETTKGVLSGFSQEEIAAGKAKGAIQDYIKSIREATVARAAFNEFQKINDQLAELEVKGLKAMSTMDIAALKAKGLGKYLSYYLVGGRVKDQQELDDISNIVGNNQAGSDAIVKQQKENLQKQLKDLTDKYSGQITAELTKTSPTDTSIVASNKRTVDSIEAEIKKLKEEQSAVSETSAQYSKYEAQIKKLEEEKARITGKQSSSQKKELSDRQKFLEKLAELEQDAFRKSLTQNEEEIKAAQQKAEELRKEAKKNGLGAGVLTRIDNIESKETGNLQYRQDTESLETELDKQKQLYVDFEAYKTSLGKTAADARYKNEIDTTVNFLQKLEVERGKLLDKDPTKMTGPELERLKVYDELINAEVASEARKQDDLMKSLISYQQERLNLTTKYQADLSTIENNPAAKEELTKKYNNDLKSLDEANLLKLESYQKLFDGVGDLSKKSALKLVSDARSLLQKNIKSGEIVDPAEIEKIRKYFDQIEKSIKSGLGDGLITIANNIDNIVSAVGGVDSAFGKVLSTVSNVVGQVGNINKGFEALNKEGASPLDKLGAGLGIIGAGISIFKSLFDKSAQREAEAKYARDIQNRQQEASNKLLERQISLIDEAYGTDRILKYDQALKTARENEAKYAADVADNFKTTGNLLTDSFLKQINEGVDPKKLKGGNFFERNEFLNDFYDGKFSKIGDISKLTVQELQALATGGPIDEGTQKLFENLINAKQAAIDLVNKLNAENIGQSLDSLADTFISTLTDGVGDFGKTFEETIRKSILNGFKSQFIQEQLQAFYTQFADLSKGGLTADEIATLRIEYDKAQAAGEQKLKDLEAISGVKLTDTGSGSSDTMKGRIESITSTQADKLEGLFNGFRLGQLEANSLLKPIDKTTLELLSIATSNFETFKRIEANTLRTADNTSRLKKVEEALVSIDNKMSDNKNALAGNGHI